MKKLFLIIILFILGTVFLVPLIFIGGLIFVLEADERETNQEIISFYKDAGFRGQVLNIQSETTGPLRLEYTYTYEEETGNGKITVNFADRLHGMGEKNKGEFFDSSEELANNYSNDLVDNLFVEAFEQSSGFKNLEEKVKKSISQAGIVSRDIYLEDDYYSDNSTVTKSELAKDLKSSPSDAPLRGLTTLDFDKYNRLGMYQIAVYLDKPIADFNLNLLTTLNLPDSRYIFYVPEQVWSQRAGEEKVYYDAPSRYLVFEVKNGNITVELDETDKYKK
ncbi:MAG: hypothetical protein Q3988_06075 [Gemella sp.]|nr:hypothetical protein [Gemella sp.]